MPPQQRIVDALQVAIPLIPRIAVSNTQQPIRNTCEVREMNAWKLPDGRVLIPKRAEADGVIGDGLIVVSAESAEAAAWSAWTKPAPADLIKQWTKMKGSQQ